MSLNENLTMEEELEFHEQTVHNFEYTKALSHALPAPFAKELFMANLGMSKVSNASESQSSSSIRTHSSRQTRQTLREERCNPYGMLQSRLVQVQDKISSALDRERVLMQQPREEPLHKMILWLMDLPQRCELSRLSFSALRCNECYLCEGVEYPCVRCRQQFHQECHADQGRRQPHRLCPSCTRQNTIYSSRFPG
ncbi:uncharacterized protein LOC115771320 [Drosophila novamexicana]|uniref:uncharacterized protein LOC115771320 n=1 Tax=Drosophila novamexicana TaxID=47314 RepID=UPI0011E5B787|nr:uncharacterized protein LOC115771320 [Drosophila novamexicana]